MRANFAFCCNPGLFCCGPCISGQLKTIILCFEEACSAFCCSLILFSFYAAEQP